MHNFVEMNYIELMETDGGWDWGIVLGGAAVVVECLAVAATAPASLPILAAGALLALSGLGGFAMGYGATH